MVGFGLILGHLVGDFLLQGDWQAANKSNPWPGPKPDPAPGGGLPLSAMNDWYFRAWRWRVGHLACALHCTLYSLAVWAMSLTWMPWWGPVVCWVSHFPVDRWKLARLFMRYTRHEAFATGPLAPWSVVVVDQILHLLVLFGVAACAGR